MTWGNFFTLWIIFTVVIVTIAFIREVFQYRAGPAKSATNMDAVRKGVKAGVLDADTAVLMYQMGKEGAPKTSIDPREYPKAWQENKAHLEKWNREFEEALGGMYYGPPIPGDLTWRRDAIPVEEVRALFKQLEDEADDLRNAGWNQRIRVEIEDEKERHAYNLKDGYKSLAEGNLATILRLEAELRPVKATGSRGADLISLAYEKPAGNGLRFDKKQGRWV